MAYTDSIVLSVHFEHLLKCGLVSDIFHYFRMMNFVGMFVSF